MNLELLNKKIRLVEQATRRIRLASFAILKTWASFSLRAASSQIHGMSTSCCLRLLPVAILLSVFATNCMLIANAQSSQSTASESTGTDLGVSGGAGKLLYGQVGVSEVLTSDVKRGLGFRTATERDGTSDVTGVQDGSPAFQAGLQVGDHVTNVDRQGDVVSLTIEKAGQSKTIRLSLESSGAPPTLSLRLPRPDTSTPDRTPFALNAQNLAAFVKTNQEQPMPLVNVSETARFLSRYDVELIVDASMSMRKPDCPGFMSRWNWCGAQSVALARELAPSAPQGITLTSFNRFFDVYEHQNPQQLTTLFARTNLALNTRLAEPLADRLNDFFVHRQTNHRPLLIAVITDGVPHPREEPQMVIDVLIHAANQIQDPRELTVVFFQIGSRDLQGQEYLQELDNKLVARGARFDIVQTVSFDHLQQVGLAQGLADAIRNFDYKIHN